MGFYTKTEARAAANRVRGLRTSSQILQQATNSYRSTQVFDIFLSHSVSDYDLVLGVKTLLEEQGLEVYVDWIVDSQLSREHVDKTTAETLRMRMKQSKSLMYIATENSSQSKWMPWELGFFDGHKPGCVAILPLVDYENQSFEGQEYLGLYPVVTKHRQPAGNTAIFVEERGRQWSHFGTFAKGVPFWQAYKP
jgi:hypothetical protein